MYINKNVKLYASISYQCIKYTSKLTGFSASECCVLQLCLRVLMFKVTYNCFYYKWQFSMSCREKIHINLCFSISCSGAKCRSFSLLSTEGNDSRYLYLLRPRFQLKLIHKKSLSNIQDLVFLCYTRVFILHQSSIKLVK